ncbi:unnamed protein product, partial [Adineta steineri]
KSVGITDLFNCETFPNSMIVLFQICTTSSWPGVFQALTNDRQPDCDSTIKSPSNNGDHVDALRKNFLDEPDLLGENSLGGDPPIDIKKDRPKDYHPLTTRLQRQREIYLSRLGLNGFRTNLQRSRNQQLILEKPIISQTD